MKPYLLIWPLVALIGLSGCIPIAVQTYSVSGDVINLPNPDTHGPLTLQLNNGFITNATPVGSETLEVYPLGYHDFTPQYSSANPLEPYIVTILSQPNGYTCSFNTLNYEGTYFDVNYPKKVNLTCVPD